MTRKQAAWIMPLVLASAVGFGLAAPASAQQIGPAQMIVMAPQPVVAPIQLAQATTVVIAPTAPPALRMENVPPPPVGQASMFWRPGHWAYTEGNWAWDAGVYVARPQATAVWEPGHWDAQPGGYAWVDGHWR